VEVGDSVTRLGDLSRFGLFKCLKYRQIALQVAQTSPKSRHKISKGILFATFLSAFAIWGWQHLATLVELEKARFGSL